MNNTVIQIFKRKNLKHGCIIHTLTYKLIISNLWLHTNVFPQKILNLPSDQELRNTSENKPGERKPIALYV